MITAELVGLEEEKIKALKIAFKLKHKRNITYKEIVAKLVKKAKLKDIE